MRDQQTFAQDAAAILRDELAAGRIDRRSFLQGLAALGVAPMALAGGGAFAQAAKPKEVVLANFGGDAVPAFTEAFAKPFEAANGVKMAIDGSGRQGFIKGRARVTLVPDANRTRVQIAAQADVGGMIARVGQRLLEGVARTMMDRFYACLAKQVT